jgi:hypothetical protein
MTSFDASVLIDTDFTPINPSGLEAPCCIVRLLNLTDQTIIFSTNQDGPQFAIGSFQDYKIQAQLLKRLPGDISLFAKGTVFYASTFPGSLPPKGTIIIAKYSQYRN